MLSFLFVFLAVLCYSTMPGNGQCTIPSCRDSASESDESLIKTFEEHDHKMTIMHQNLSSAIGKLREDVNRSIVRVQGDQDQNMKMAFLNLSSKVENIEEKFRVSDQRLAKDLEEHGQNMKSIYHNMSLNFESICGRIDKRNECISVEEIEQKLTTMSNRLSRAERIDESVQSVNENLMKILERNDQDIRSVHQNFSSRFEKNEKTLAAVEVIVNLVVKKEEENGQKLETSHQNLSSNFGRVDERIQSVNENLVKNALQHDQSMRSVYQNISLRFGENDEKLRLMNESVVNALKEHDRKFQTILENISLSIEKMNEKLNSVIDRVNESLLYIKSQDPYGGNPTLCDCSTIRANGNTTSGVYRIYVDHQNERHYANAFCDMTTGNRTWTVFQRRKDGSEDFYRGWNDYAIGFGNPSGEFWLGNEFLHFLTSKRRYRLRIDLEDFEGGKRYAEYSTFNISSAADKYRLRIGTYSGNAGDSLSVHNGRQFSTKDQDNDAAPYNCALSRHAGGAWWYKYCYYTNLNGFYYRTGRYSCSSDCSGIVWYHWRNTDQYSLKSTEMKISYY